MNRGYIQGKIMNIQGGESSNSAHVEEFVVVTSELQSMGKMDMELSFRDLDPNIEIIEQPQPRGFRFRYECEGPSHGGLQGEKSQRHKKSYPAIKINNYNGPAKVVVTIVTDEDVPKPHAHKLVGKNCKDGNCTVELKGGCNTVSFPNLCVQHVTRKKASEVIEARIVDSLKLDKKVKMGDLNMDIELTEEEKANAKNQAEKQAKEMQLNVVKLCFQAYLRDENGFFNRLLPSVLSSPIYDSKSPGANALKICRMDKYGGCCTGDDEVFLLCEKVQKEDIQVRFVEQNDDGEIVWQDYGVFGPYDVHRQYAIVFKTPPYRDQNIDKPVSVLIMLERKTDMENSDPKSFTYFPQNTDKDDIQRKKLKRLPAYPNSFGDDSDYSNGPNIGRQNNGLQNNTSDGFPISGNLPITVNQESDIPAPSVSKLASKSSPKSGGSGKPRGRPRKIARYNEYVPQDVESDGPPSSLAFQNNKQSFDVTQQQQQQQQLKRFLNQTGGIQRVQQATPSFHTSVVNQHPRFNFGGQQRNFLMEQSHSQFQNFGSYGQTFYVSNLPTSLPVSGSDGEVTLISRSASGGVLNDKVKNIHQSTKMENYSLGLNMKDVECNLNSLDSDLDKGHSRQDSLASSENQEEEERENKFNADDEEDKNSANQDDLDDLETDCCAVQAENIFTYRQDHSSLTVDKLNIDFVSERDQIIKNTYAALNCSGTDDPCRTARGGCSKQDVEVQTETDNSIKLAEKTANAIQHYAKTGDIRSLLLVQRFLTFIADDSGDLPLHTAVINKQFDVVKNLLDVMETLPEGYKKINAHNKQLQTPLHLAVLTDQPSMVELLVQSGAHPGVVDKHGNTSNCLAVLNNHLNCLTLMLKYTRPKVTKRKPFPELDVKNFDGLAPLHIAAEKKNINAARLLVSGKADVNLPEGKCGRTPLHFAVIANDLAVSRFLLFEANANVNATCFDGNTALHIACSKKYVAMVNLLMSAGADPYLENEDMVEIDGGTEDGIKRDYSEEEECLNCRGLLPKDFASGDEKILRLLDGELIDENDFNKYVSEKDKDYDKTSQLMSSLSVKSCIGTCEMSDIAGTMDLIPYNVRMKLSDILDPKQDGRDWRTLAELLDMKSVINFDISGNSPTRMILTYFENLGGTRNQLVNALSKMGRNDAINIIDQQTKKLSGLQGPHFPCDSQSLPPKPLDIDNASLEHLHLSGHMSS